MKVYCIGIGGIGVSALARKYLAEGHQVSGSDRAASLVTTELEKLGVKISFAPKAENISTAIDLVIYTLAIPDSQPELLQAKKLKLKILSYPEALGELSRSHFTIAIAGTHGKTTTTAMLGEIALAAGLDPTIIVGSLLKNQQSNFIAGKSKYLIVEACEYKRSFLNLSPQILVITNIDNDHLDYYRDLADIQSAFATLAGKSNQVITEKDYAKIKTDFKLSMPGAHNIKNAQAALAVAAALGIDYTVAVAALENFRGTWRRFDYKGQTKSGAKVYDDYAHHPTEIKATLSGARELVKKNRIFVVFQPHLYSRTKLLFNDFVGSFADADEVIITDIYAARELADPSVSGDKLAQAITTPPTRYLKNFADIADYLQKTTKSGDIIIVMGAGDISQLADLLL